MFTKIIDWVKKNWIISIIAFFALLILIFPKFFKGFLRVKKVRHRHYIKKTSPVSKKISYSNTKKGYPGVGGTVIPFKYNADGKIKKAQFVAGTLAAKRYMAKLRRSR